MKNKACIIGICGGSGSGKSTVTKKLIELIGKDNVSIIEQDSSLQGPVKPCLWRES